MASTKNIQAPDDYVEELHQALSVHPEMRRFYQAQQNGSIEAAQGPPESLRKQEMIQVPQYIYDAPSWKCDPATFPPIVFRTSERKGIRLTNALAQNTADLHEPDEQLTQLSSTTKTTYRLEVVKYKPFNRAMPALRATARNESLARWVVANHVARAVEECIQRDGGSWEVATIGRVTFNDLWLMELRRVSQGSWQPVLAFYHP
ncbi:hypothetical protein NM688_g2259 [Phlebia brevispora]|uniref:Uncharacterized protein n=1 Tax=Phlebia brevispora TaxID=194682 RepID=A0ACC1T9B6_9APHY|nr:hypothetical protein NM688_g2259 [Phlebia brevispora]